MTSVLIRTADRFFPVGANKHGPLPVLLIVLSVVTGIVDAVSYLGLRHVFVANMTGNVVFLGFAVGGAKSLSVWGSLTAIGAFVVGAWTEGRFGVRVADRSRLFRIVISAHTVLLAAAVAVAAAFGTASAGAQATLLVVLGGGMGMQNAVARRVAVPDMTTTVLTLTLTGLASEHPSHATVRRLASVVSIFVGALVGAALSLHASAGWALTAALVLLVAVTVAAPAPEPPRG
jgi:uncharacterized membrane protein YoaK (UPF0700 family)